MPPKKPAVTMTKWRSHKIVEAGTIYAFKDNNVVTVLVPPMHYLDVTVPADWTARGKPKLGDFLVRYEDGYISWSPKEVFLAGYTAIE